MTLKELLLQSSTHLTKSSTPLLDVEILLSFVLKKNRSYLISHSEETLPDEQEKHFRKLIEERSNGKPIAYITNEKEFFGRSFYVDERVLIPRPETEEIVEDVIKYLRENPQIRTVIDLGTGSGAIAITLARECLQFAEGSSQLKYIGLEISTDALAVAKINAQKHHPKNLEFIESDLLNSLPTADCQLPTVIIANLPYIGTHTNHFISEETERYEPHLALFGGSDGLELYRRTWQQIKDMNLNVAALFMEIGFSQVETISKQAQEAFPDYEFTIKNDLAGLPRTAVLLKL
jgi:release factor glutamine methyltransferase